MNIFILHKDIQQNAQYHSDQHVRKMILETAQLLSFCLHRFGAKEGFKKDKIYKYSKSHGEHPCAKWVYESTKNYRYLANLGIHLCIEYNYRFGKVHATTEVMRYLAARIPNIPKPPLTPFALVMPTTYQRIDKIENKRVFRNAVKSYRNYYNHEKHTFKNGPATWTNREIPVWFKPQEKLTNA